MRVLTSFKEVASNDLLILKQGTQFIPVGAVVLKYEEISEDDYYLVLNTFQNNTGARCRQWNGSKEIFVQLFNGVNQDNIIIVDPIDSNTGQDVALETGPNVVC